MEKGDTGVAWIPHTWLVCPPVLLSISTFHSKWGKRVINTAYGCKVIIFTTQLQAAPTKLHVCDPTCALMHSIVVTFCVCCCVVSRIHPCCYLVLQRMTFNGSRCTSLTFINVNITSFYMRCSVFFLVHLKWSLLTNCKTGRPKCNDHKFA